MMYQLTRDICEILDIIESHLFPGIIKKSFSIKDKNRPISSFMKHTFSIGQTKKLKEIKDFQELLQSLCALSRFYYYDYIHIYLSKNAEKYKEVSRVLEKYGEDRSVQMRSWKSVYPKDNPEFYKYDQAFMNYVKNKIPCET
ncbi:hypothetical protein PGT21_015162 [Puccinia graminis f. sp. tritici]|uniref:Uncharacterized protein n=1 Tax=Puccinia graminis f. sp. tritici TaxID=56615 RepID=A0A5B0M8N2_PUCGR|nr:hypothetical protein PGT21_015162 [Puccinia graminis f. sp. tritici]